MNNQNDKKTSIKKSSYQYSDAEKMSVKIKLSVEEDCEEYEVYSFSPNDAVTARKAYRCLGGRICDAYGFPRTLKTYRLILENAIGVTHVGWAQNGLMSEDVGDAVLQMEQDVEGKVFLKRFMAPVRKIYNNLCTAYDIPKTEVNYCKYLEAFLFYLQRNDETNVIDPNEVFNIFCEIERGGCGGQEVS